MAQVDAIKESITELAEVFHTRMAELQHNLEKAGPSNPSVASVAADFSTFKVFILKTLNMLQKQVEYVAQQVDGMEMRSRRKMLVLHGLKGSRSDNSTEDTTALVVGKLKLIKASLTAEDIRRCHRLGKPRTGKPEPVLVKFRDVTLRDEIWFGKVALKGSGVTLGEFLTKPRHDIFVAARDQFGVRNCWSWNGDVFVLDAAGTKHRVTSLAQMSSISVPARKAAAPPPTEEESSQAATQPSRRPKRVQKPQLQ